MKRIGLVGFDQFTDIDLFLAWDLFHRIGAECSVRLLAATPTITSSTGIRLDRGGPLEAASDMDAVYVCSGRGSRALADDPRLGEMLRLDESRQILAAIDSGAIVLARLGFLRGREATTYPAPDLYERLRADGATPVRSALVVAGNVATAAQCLAGVELVRWTMTRLFDASVADAAVATASSL